jgi:hypothetical protein
MGFRENLQKLADKKLAEIRQLEVQLAQAEAYLQAIQDSIKVAPKEDEDGTGSETILRPGSALARAQELLKSAGRPLHISEILTQLGKPNDKPNRISLSGSMAAYVRKRVIFKKTGPNTFGLIGMGNSTASTEDGKTVLPDAFGSVQ